MDAVSGDALPSGLLVVDADDCVCDCNGVLIGWTGLIRADIIGRPLVSVIAPPGPSVPPDSPEGEYLPALAFVDHVDGSRTPVLVAEGRPDADGSRHLVLFDARAQREFRERMDRRHGLIERTQRRLQLVIDASIAFAEAASETLLAEVLAATTSKAYAAEESAVFLLDDDLVFRQVAGTNPFGRFDEPGSLTARARELRTVLKISGIEQARATAPALGAAFEAAGVQSMIVAPIHQGRQPLGILAAFFHHPRQFDEQAAPLADALAGQAARAISALRLQQRLEHAAMHDDTTGLPNRRLLEEWIEGSDRRREATLGVLFVDLDGFKNVNDQLGHQIGDQVLREVAVRLQSAVREEDVVARYGGDEFVIVCEVSDENAAFQMAERVRESIRAPYDSLPAGLTIGASIGVSFAGAESSSGVAERLVREADQAMYRAKNAGGNRIASTAV